MRPWEMGLNRLIRRLALPSVDKAAQDVGMPLTTALREAAAQEQLRMLLLHTRLGTVLATTFAVLLTVQLLDRLPHHLALIWLTVKLLVAASRIALAHAYLRRGGDAERWQRRVHALLAVDGVVWGAAGLLLAHQPPALAAMVIAALDAVACLATFGLQFSRRATLAYVAPMLSLLAIGMLERGDELGRLAAIGQALVLVLTLSTAYATAPRLLAGVLLRLKAQDLAQQKDAALQLANEQSALRKQFLAKVSHELRTPLHGILGMARLLHLETADRSAGRRLELIETSGNHLLGLINDLLDVARIDSGRFALHEEDFDLHDLLAQTSEVFSLRAADKGLAWRFHSTLPQPHWVHGDPVRLRQVLTNLLANAVKFTYHGQIALEAAPGTAPDCVQLAVSDTGSGIVEADRGLIFQAFSQLPNDAARPTDGVGLGLTIAREIANAMGGDITLHSTPGQGSRFVVQVRMPVVDAVAPSTPASPAGHQRLPRLVLVAEDDEVNALIVAAFLDSLGVRSERVADGRQAIARAMREVERPELLLLDCRMPVMDGPTAAREIRRQERVQGRPRLPILALTAATTDADRTLCMDAGIDDVIAKPFTPEQLARAMRDAGRKTKDEI